MAFYDISREGVANFQQLSQDLRSLNGDIAQEGQKLRQAVVALSDSLGIYSDKILEMLDSVNNIQEKASGSIDLLVIQVNEQAKRIESIVASVEKM